MGSGNLITNINIIGPQTKHLFEIRILVQSLKGLSRYWNYIMLIPPSMTKSLRDADCKIEGLQV